MKKLLGLIAISIFFMSCSEEEVAPQHVTEDVTFGVNISLLKEEVTNMNGRSYNNSSLPAGFNHVLGGIGTIQFVESTGAYTVLAEFDGSEIDSIQFSVPSGTYNINIFFSNDGCKATEYFPYTASATNVEITESTTNIDLNAQSEYGLVLIKDQYLVSDGSFTSPYFNGEIGTGFSDNNECDGGDIRTVLNGDYYYAYLHNSINTGELGIFYESSDVNIDYNSIIVDMNIESQKIYKFTITDNTNTSNLDFDLESIWTVEEFNFGLN